MSGQLTVGFDNLVVDCIIGINPPERTTPQPLLIDMRVKMRPLERHTKTDGAKGEHQKEEEENKEDDTKSGIVANYSDLAACCRTMALDGQCGLLETLAKRMGNQILADYAPDAVSVYVRLRKPRALRDAVATVEYEATA
ncbi:dihydroneopterin aldolase [Pandoravirus inopinatum]|uniref:Dihydroneopterin aldolase n=1 Tax=Pandoravirus inopinatum TaxID=1605721 RepID=A0A0B5J006_9VIRU|nr:dihydroneopterin aldolase [Pandoravirus inopinatum]AJF98548.1 dihydroneopterin aldolase [Pandoravirus inopinatum]